MVKNTASFSEKSEKDDNPLNNNLDSNVEDLDRNAYETKTTSENQPSLIEKLESISTTTQKSNEFPDLIETDSSSLDETNMIEMPEQDAYFENSLLVTTKINQIDFDFMTDFVFKNYKDKWEPEFIKMVKTLGNDLQGPRDGFTRYFQTYNMERYTTEINALDFDPFFAKRVKDEYFRVYKRNLEVTVKINDDNILKTDDIIDFYLSITLIKPRRH